MKILLVAATPFEIAPVLDYLEKNSTKKSFLEFTYKDKSIFPLITGVGAVKTAFALARFSEIQEIDIAINIGVAGAFNKSLSLGQVIEVEKDKFGDLGVEEQNGDFTDVYELGLEKKNDFIHSDSWIINENELIETELNKVAGLTVNTVHGSQESIERIQSKYKADIESMEGAAFFYACKSMDVKCMQIRAISNYVEPRNRQGWELEKAINNVNASLIQLIDLIESAPRRTIGF